MKKNLTNWRYSKGMSLLEVLIAAVILGVGLLGISALQMTALQGSSNAEYRGRASDHAWSLADRMRANIPGTLIAGNFPYDQTTPACTASPPVACAMIPGSALIPVQCTPAQIAAFDLWETRCSNGLKKNNNVDGGIRGELPGGTMFVTSTTDSRGVITNIQIDWLTRSTDNAAQTLTDMVVMSVVIGSDPGLKP